MGHWYLSIAKGTVIKMAAIQQLIIDQKLAEIGVEVKPAKMRISTPRMQMKITTESPHMKIERKAPSFRMNRKSINSESGLKPPMELTKMFRSEGISAVLSGAKTAGEDGDFIGDARIQGNRIAKLSRNKSLASATRKKQLDLRLMPQHSPEVNWEKGYLRINWSKHSIKIDWDGEYLPQLTIDPKYSVEVFLRTEPYFRITVQDLEDPNTPGRYVDQEI
jgi:hypothetical protein